MTKKLQAKGCAAEDIAAVLARLEEWSYIDDADYARQYCRCKRERYSCLRLRLELRQRGVDKETAEAVLAAEYPSAQEEENCRRALEKAGTDRQKKTAAALYRQGYRAESIKRALDASATA
jgi:SOS response regulatory protein OraA/RecX